MTRGPAVLLLLPLLAGCLTPSPASPALQAPAPIRDEAEVMVGIIDGGINPYHMSFQAPNATLPAWFKDSRTGRPPIEVSLSSSGSFAERFEQDAAVWESLQKDTLYWFEGTRVLGYSLLEDAPYPRLSDEGGHGSGVASTIKNVSGDAWVVMVQFPANVPLPGEGSETTMAAFEKAATGMRWLAEQPWVDVISLSIGFQGNPPLPMWDAFVSASRSAVDQGKVVVAAAGNQPVPTVAGGTNGPPWVIVVGGVEGETRGEQPSAAKMVDVVADFTRMVAGREPDEYRLAGGTSYAAPAVAGTIAQALLELRRSQGWSREGSEGLLCDCSGLSLSNVGLREALNVTAEYWSTLEYDPLNHTEASPIEEVLYTTVPILPTPWVQMGWGYVGNDTWRTMVEALQGRPPPPHSTEAVQYMAAQQAAREAYWSLPR